MIENASTGLALKVNGSVLAVARRPQLQELEPALRGIALSDSPVLVCGDSLDANHVVERLHVLSRRSHLPLRSVHSQREAEPLLRAIHETGDVRTDALGTWALHNVHWWSPEEQLDLAAILAELDEARLHGRLAHQRIPRVLVITRLGDKPGKLEPDLEQRLTFFNVTVQAANRKGAR